MIGLAVFTPLVGCITAPHISTVVNCSASCDKGAGAREEGQGRRGKGGGAREEGQGRRSKGGGAREEGQGRRGKGGGAREEGQGRRGKGGAREEGQGRRGKGGGSREEGQGRRGKGGGAREEGQGRRGKGGVTWIDSNVYRFTKDLSAIPTPSLVLCVCDWASSHTQLHDCSEGLHTLQSYVQT